jgi:hypothetical protein
LQHVPVFGQHAVLDPDDVGGDPVGLIAAAGESAVQDHVVTVGDDELVFVAQLGWRGFDEIEQALAAGFDVGAVLDVVRGPEPLGAV